MSEIYVGRQPIFDRRLNVIGYELLYRNLSSALKADIIDADRATSDIILNIFSDLSLEAIVGEHKAFVNMTLNFLTEKYPIPFPPNQMVLEVPENIVIDDTLVASLEVLSKRGYLIALDDITDPQAISPLLSVAHILKIDLVDIDRADLEESILSLKDPHRKLLAEKVETQEDFELCKRLGFDYFQGYFFCRPRIMHGQKIPPSRLIILQLLHHLQNPEISFQTLEEIVAQDVSTGYKLLRLVNSSYYGLNTTIKSMRQAMALLGLEQLRSWLTLFLLSSAGDKPRELTIIAMTRAKMCEIMATALGETRAETYFLTGLFSVLDALLDMPMDQIVTALSLSEDIIQALLEHKGRLGSVLQSVIAYENGAWDQVAIANQEVLNMRDIYLEALHWVQNITQTLVI